MADMRYLITTTLRFRASHQLRLYDGSLEEKHEHDWQVKVTVGCAQLDTIGVVMDFHQLAATVEAIIQPLRLKNLGETSAFAHTNPSAENLAIYIGRALGLPDGIQLQAVEVWETPENSAVYQR